MNECSVLIRVNVFVVLFNDPVLKLIYILSDFLTFYFEMQVVICFMKHRQEGIQYLFSISIVMCVIVKVKNGFFGDVRNIIKMQLVAPVHWPLQRLIMMVHSA